MKQKKSRTLKLAANCGLVVIVWTNKSWLQTFPLISKLISLCLWSNLVHQQLFDTPLKNTQGQKDGWTLAALTEVNDFPSHVSWEVNTRTQTAALWPCLDAWALLRSWDPYLPSFHSPSSSPSPPPSPAQRHPALCPPTFIMHFLFMLGRNRGCSW